MQANEADAKAKAGEQIDRAEGWAFFIAKDEKTSNPDQEGGFGLTNLTTIKISIDPIKILAETPQHAGLESRHSRNLGKLFNLKPRQFIEIE
jgi:hypothetical protein